MTDTPATPPAPPSLPSFSRQASSSILPSGSGSGSETPLIYDIPSPPRLPSMGSGVLDLSEIPSVPELPTLSDVPVLPTLNDGTHAPTSSASVDLPAKSVNYSAAAVDTPPAPPALHADTPPTPAALDSANETLTNTVQAVTAPEGAENAGNGLEQRLAAVDALETAEREQLIARPDVPPAPAPPPPTTVATPVVAPVLSPPQPSEPRTHSVDQAVESTSPVSETIPGERTVDVPSHVDKDVSMQSPMDTPSTAQLEHVPLDVSPPRAPPPPAPLPPPAPTRPQMDASLVGNAIRAPPALPQTLKHPQGPAQSVAAEDRQTVAIEAEKASETAIEATAEAVEKVVQQAKAAEIAVEPKPAAITTSIPSPTSTDPAPTTSIGAEEPKQDIQVPTSKEHQSSIMDRIKERFKSSETTEQTTGTDEGMSDEVKIADPPLETETPKSDDRTVNGLVDLTSPKADRVEAVAAKPKFLAKNSQIVQETPREPLEDAPKLNDESAIDKLTAVVSKLPDPTILFMGLLSFLLLLFAIDSDLLRNIVSRLIFPPAMFLISASSLVWKKPVSQGSGSTRDIAEAEARILAAEERIQEQTKRFTEQVPIAEDLERKLRAAASTRSPSVDQSPLRRVDADSSVVPVTNPSPAVLPGDSDAVASARRDVQAINLHASGSYGTHTEKLRKKYLLGLPEDGEDSGTPGRVSESGRPSLTRSSRGIRGPKAGGDRSEFRNFFEACLPKRKGKESRRARRTASRVSVDAPKTGSSGPRDGPGASNASQTITAD